MQPRQETCSDDEQEHKQKMRGPMQRPKSQKQWTTKYDFENDPSAMSDLVERQHAST
jgi:hypothetical protein